MVLRNRFKYESTSGASLWLCSTSDANTSYGLWFLLGNSASQDFAMCCAFVVEVLRILPCSIVKWPTSIVEICRDDESVQELRRRVSKSWLVKFPRLIHKPEEVYASDIKSKSEVSIWCRLIVKTISEYRSLVQNWLLALRITPPL